MEYDMEKAGRMWDQYVGGQGPEEFMGLSGTDDVREAVSEYLAHLDEMFGAGTADNAPEDLEDALVAYIEASTVIIGRGYAGERWVVYNAAVAMMDDEIREELHNELAPCTNQEFMDAYLARHKERFGEEFTI